MEAWLEKEDIKPLRWLRLVKANAKANGYEPKRISYADDSTHKLKYTTPENKTVFFGALGYGDYLLYKLLERRKEVPAGTAEKKRANYRARAFEARGDWKDDKYSPNNLAIYILW